MVPALRPELLLLCPKSPPGWLEPVALVDPVVDAGAPKREDPMFVVPELFPEALANVDGAVDFPNMLDEFPKSPPLVGVDEGFPNKPEDESVVLEKPFAAFQLLPCEDGAAAPNMVSLE